MEWLQYESMVFYVYFHINHAEACILLGSYHFWMVFEKYFFSNKQDTVQIGWFWIQYFWWIFSVRILVYMVQYLFQWMFMKCCFIISDAEGSRCTQYTFFLIGYLWQMNVYCVLYCFVVVGASYVIWVSMKMSVLRRWIKRCWTSK